MEAGPLAVRLHACLMAIPLLIPAYTLCSFMTMTEFFSMD
jgi:hypothetical protein